MPWGELEFLATIAIQLIIGGIAMGKLWQGQKDNKDRLNDHDKQLMEQGKIVFDHEGRITRLENHGS